MPAHFSLVTLLQNPKHEILQFLHVYGAWAYLILFVIVFCETGLVITPFLPGDSLLMAAGLVANNGGFDPLLLCGVLILAALLGDNVNYYIGKKLGRKLFHNEKSKIFNRKSLDKTHAFFERYGGRTVIIARFLPVFRTFAPFVAGMGKMRYRTFMLYSVLAASLWVILFVTVGYSFSKAAWVEKNFWLFLLALVLISAFPGLLEIVRHMRAHKRDNAGRVEVDPEQDPEPVMSAPEP